MRKTRKEGKKERQKEWTRVPYYDLILCRNAREAAVDLRITVRTAGTRGEIPTRLSVGGARVLNHITLKGEKKKHLSHAVLNSGLVKEYTPP